MRSYPSPLAEWSPERKVREIKSAGFAAIQTHPDLPLVSPARKAGLRLIGNIDIGAEQNIDPILMRCKEAGMDQVNVQLADHDTSPDVAVNLAIQLVAACKRLKVIPSVEIHRNTCTETPEKMIELLTTYEKSTGERLRCTFDYSHHAVVKHLEAAAFWENLRGPQGMIALSSIMHLRPFNGHHCQIPVTNGNGALSPEFSAWLPFCQAALGEWVGDGSVDRELFVIPELGPVESGYALSCFPDIWGDLIELTNQIRASWRQVTKNRPADLH